MSRYLYIFSILAAPQISKAATSVQGLLTESSEFISGTLIVFLFGLAFLFIVINVFRYFILGGADQEGQKKAKALAVYGVAAFVFLITFYGIVNVLTGSTGLAGESVPPSDFFGLGDWNGDDGSGGSGGSGGNQSKNIEADLLNPDGNQIVGQSIFLKGTVRNTGTISVSSFSSNFSYCWTTSEDGCDFSDLSSHNVDSLESGLSQTQASDSLSLTQAGTLRVKYCVDSGNTILESNEDDNCTETEYEIEGDDTRPKFEGTPTVTNCLIKVDGRMCTGLANWKIKNHVSPEVKENDTVISNAAEGTGVRVGLSYMSTNTFVFSDVGISETITVVQTGCEEGLKWNEETRVCENDGNVPINDKNLTASWVLLNSGELIDGETVTFKGRVMNIGSDITDASNLKSSFKWCLVSGEVCNYSLLTDRNTSIPFSTFAEQVDISTSLVLNQPGKIRIQYCVDSGNVITETNENDNCKESTFNIIVNNGVDLSSNALPQHLGTAIRGNNVIFTGKVTNGQTEINTEFKSVFKYCWGDGCLPNTSMDFMDIYAPLESNENRPIMSATYILQQSGKLRVRLCVDNTNLIDEIDETNNCSSIKTIDVAEN
jgi:hypothetical protein